MIRLSVFLLVISEGLLAYLCFVLSTFWAISEEVTPSLYLWDDGGWLALLLCVIAFQIGLYFLDLYDEIQPTSYIDLVQQCTTAIGLGFLVQAIIGYVARSLLVPKWPMVYGSALVILVFPLWRKTFYALARYSLPKRRVLFMGISSSTKAILEYLRLHPEDRLHVLGYLDDEPSPDFPASYLGTTEQLSTVVEKQQPNHIVIELQHRQKPLPLDELLNYRFRGIHVENVTSTFENVFLRIPIQELQPAQIIFSTVLGPLPWITHLQNLYSVTLGLVGALLFSPVMLIVAILVKITSPGPVIFSQRRVGLHGRIFNVYKFRSMYVDAEARTGAVWATRDDPRVTPLGRWLRKLRLDELPQFFNVIRADMALVGPRPERPEFVELLEQKIPFYSQRHCVKPGITGWAQINYKYGETIEDTVRKLEYDLYYIKHLTPALDMFILLQTVKVMLLSRGGQ